MPLRTFLASPGPRRLAGWVLGVSVFTALFAVSFLGAFHQPKPHNVPIAVVAQKPAIISLQRYLDRRIPGAYKLEQFRSARQARTSLRDAVVDAVWIPPSLPVRPPGGTRPVAQLFTASALGAVPTQVIAQTFESVGRAADDNVTDTDLAPLPIEDPLGVTSFFFNMGVFLPSFLGSVVMTVLLRRAPALATMTAILVLAACVGLINATIVDAGFGALAGHFGTLIGIAALTSLAFSAPTVAAGRLTGLIGAPLALLVFVVLGAPASGGPFGPAFLPGFQRALSPVLPLANAVAAVRNATYFGGHELGGHLDVLAAWAGAGLLVLTVFAVLESASAGTQAASSPSSTPGSTGPSPLNPSGPLRISSGPNPGDDVPFGSR